VFSYETRIVSYEKKALSYEIALVSYEKIELSYGSALDSYEKKAISHEIKAIAQANEGSWTESGLVRSWNINHYRYGSKVDHFDCSSDR
jgi:hypothetical protein